MLETGKIFTETKEEQIKSLQRCLQLIDEALLQEQSQESWLKVQSAIKKALERFKLKEPLYPELIIELLERFNKFYNNPQHEKYIEISDYMDQCNKLCVLITENIEKTEPFFSLLSESIIKFSSFIDKKNIGELNCNELISFFETASACFCHMQDKGNEPLSKIANRIAAYYLSKKELRLANYYASCALRLLPCEDTKNLVVAVEAAFLYQWYIEDSPEIFIERCVYFCVRRDLEACLALCDKLFDLGDHLWEQKDLKKAENCYEQVFKLLGKIKEAKDFKEGTNVKENQRKINDRVNRYMESSDNLYEKTYSGFPDPLGLKKQLKKSKKNLKKIRDEAVKLIHEQPLQTVQSEFSKNLREKIIANLCRQIEEELGAPPVESYAILCSGSLARDEACLFSDLECVIVWNKKLPLEKAEAVNHYFKAFMQLLEFKLFALGETNELCKTADINEKSLQKNLQSVLNHMKRGLRLDEGGNYPFSVMHNDLFIGDLDISSKTSIFRIMQPDGICHGKNLKTIEHTLETVRNSERYAFIESRFLYGNESLANDLHKQTQEILNRTKYSSGEICYREMLGFILLNAEFLIVLKNDLEEIKQTKICNVKDHLLRLPQMITLSLSLFYGIEEKKSFERIAALQDKKIIGKSLAELLRETLTFAFKIRMMTHSYYGEENDQLNLNKLPDKLLAYKTDILCCLEVVQPFLINQFVAWQKTVAEDNKAVAVSLMLDTTQQITNEKKPVSPQSYFLLMYQNIFDRINYELQQPHGDITQQILTCVTEWFVQQFKNHKITTWPDETHALIKKQIMPVLFQPLLQNLAQDYDDFLAEQLIKDFKEQFENFRIDRNNQPKMLQLLQKIKAPFDVLDSLYRYLCSLNFKKHPQRREWCRWFFLYVEKSRPELILDIEAWLYFPDEEGFRIIEKIETEKLQQGLLELKNPENNTLNNEPSKITVKIHSSKHNPIKLHADVINKIIRSVNDQYPGHLHHTVCSEKSKKVYLYRNVAHIEYNGVKLHLKEHPDFPMMSQASYLFNQRLSGHGVVPSDLVIFEVTLPNKEPIFYPVLVSLTAEGPTLEKLLEENKCPSGKQWDLKRLSEVGVMEIFKHPGDGHARNYVVITLRSGKYAIVCVDNEQMFVRGFQKEGMWTKIKEINVINTLPEFQVGGELNKALSGYALQQFARQFKKVEDIDKLLHCWLNLLTQKEIEFERLLKKFPQAFSGRQQTEEHRFMEKMIFPSGVVGKLGLDLRQFWAAIREHKNLSPKQVLTICSGYSIADKYFSQIIENPLQRLNKITEQKQTVSSGESFRQFLGDSKGYSIEEVRNEITCYQLLSAHTQEKDSFTLNKDNVVMLDYGNMNEEKQTDALEQLIKCQMPFNKLYIKNCTVLKYELLKRLLKASEKTLQFLSVAGHQNITDDSLQYLAGNCKVLEVLIASGTSVNEIKAWSLRGGSLFFNSLQELRLNDCDNFTCLKIKAPKLKHLALNNNSKLKTVLFNKETAASLLSMSLQNSAHILPLLTEPLVQLQQLDLRQNTLNSILEWSYKNISKIFPEIKTVKIDIEKYQDWVQAFRVFSPAIEMEIEEEKMLAVAETKIDNIGNTVLHKAATENDLEFLLALTKSTKRWNKNITNQLGVTPFWLACYHGQFKVLEFLTAQGADANLKGKMHEKDEPVTPLYFAYREKKITIRDFLLLQPAVSLEIPIDAEQNTIIHKAAVQNDIFFFKNINKNRPNWPKEITNQNGETPLWLACSFGHLPLVKFLVQQECNVNTKGGKEKQTLLQIAYLNQHPNIVDFLLEKTNVVLETENNLLHEAIARGDLAFFESLEKHRPGWLKDLSQENSGKLLWLACESCDLSLVKYFIEHGADVNFIKEKNWENDKLLQLAFHKNEQTVLNFLMQLGIFQLDLQDENGNTLLHRAAMRGDLTFFQSIINHSSNWPKDISNKFGTTPFWLACSYGHIALVKFLMAQGVDVNAKGKEKEEATLKTPLQIACERKNLPMMELLLRQDEVLLEIEADKDKNTLFHIAAIQGNVEFFQMLTKLKIDWPKDISNKYGATPLWYACQYGKLRLAQILINQGADVNLKGSSEEKYIACTPLQIAYLNNNLKVTEFLLQQNKVSLDIALDDSGNTLLHYFAKNGDVDFFELLSKYCPNWPKNQTNKYGATPFWYACQNGNIDLIKFLVEKGANVKAKGKIKEEDHAYTPLQLALKQENQDVIKFLLQQNQASFEVEDDKDKNTLFHIAAIQGDLEFFQTFSKLGCNWPKDIRNKNEATPFWLACYHGHLELVQNLVGQGVDVNLKGKNSEYGSCCTPIQIAYEEKKLDVVEFLLQQSKVSLEIALDDDENTILHHFAKKCCLGFFQNLAKFRPNWPKDQPNKYGATPLWFACQNGNLDLLKYLIEQGADVNLQAQFWENNIRCTPIQVAYYNKKHDVVEFLLKQSKVSIEIALFENGNTILHHIAEEGGVKFFELISKHRPNWPKNQTNKYGATPLWYACRNGYLALVKYLIEQEANVNVKGKTEEKGVACTPLHIAYFNKKTDVMELLLQQSKSSLEIALNDNGDTFLHYVARKSDVAFFQLLSKYCPNWPKDISNKFGTTPFWLACSYGHIALVKFLMAQEVDANTKGKEKEEEILKTPLQIACEKKNLAVMEFLLQQDAVSLEIEEDEDKNTLFHIAAIQGNVEFFQMLTKLNLDWPKDITNKNGATPFWFACYHGNLEVVKILIEQGVDINAANEDFVSPFQISYVEGKYEVIQFLLQQEKLKLENGDKAGNTLLHCAAYLGDLPFFQMLLEKVNNWNVSSLNKYGATPLLFACEKGNLAMVKFLIEQGADVNAQGKLSKGGSIYNPILSAYWQEKHEIVEFLLQQENLILDNADEDGNTLLHDVAEKGDFAFFQLLSKHRSNWPKDPHNKYGATPLWYACQNGNLELVKYLIELGADVNVKGQTNDKSVACPLLDIAISNNNQSVTEFLLQQSKMSLDIPLDDKGHTLLHYFAIEGDLAFFQLLTKHRPNWPKDQPNKYGATPLWFACIYGKLELVKCLIDQGADVNVKGKTEEKFVACTPLQIAYICKKPDVVEYLLQQEKVSLEITDGIGETILHDAAKQGDVIFFQLLSKLRPNWPKDQTNKYGATPLWYACRNEKLDLVKYLIELGADVNVKVAIDKDEKTTYTPIQIALLFRNESVMEILLQQEKLNLEITNDCGDDIFYEAAQDDHMYFFELLTKHHPNWPKSFTNKYDTTPLCFACDHDNFELVKFLVEQRADVNVKGKSRWFSYVGEVRLRTPFQIACELGRQNIMDFLLKQENLILDITDERDRSLLDEAAREGNVVFFHKILNKMPNWSVDIKDENGPSLLLLACYSGCLELVIFLIEKGADLNLKGKIDEDDIACSPIQIAYRKDNQDVFEYLFKQEKLNLEITERNGNTLLHEAARKGDVVFFHEILNKIPNWSVDIKDENGATPLMLACNSGCLELVKFLIEKGADLNLKGKIDEDNIVFTPIQIAYRKDKKDVVEFLINHEKLNLEITERNGNTLLHEAARKGDVVFFHKILNKILNWSVDIKDENGATPLILACNSGCFELVKFLIEKGADINLKGKISKNDIAFTPIQIAYREDKKDVVEFLLKHEKLNLEITEWNGDTLLHEAAEKGDVVFFHKILNKMPNWSVDIKDENGTTQLFLACYSGCLELVMFLIEKGADINLKGKLYEDDIACPPIQIAYKQEIPNVMEILLKQENLNLEIEDEYGETVLHEAAEKGDVEFFQLLSKYRPNWPKDQINKYGATPLWYACQKGKLELVKYLIEQGADMNVKGKINEDDIPCTPIGIAKKENHQDIVKFLTQINNSQLKQLPSKQDPEINTKIENKRISEPNPLDEISDKTPSSQSSKLPKFEESKFNQSIAFNPNSFHFSQNTKDPNNNSEKKSVNGNVQTTNVINKDFKNN